MHGDSASTKVRAAKKGGLCGEKLVGGQALRLFNVVLNVKITDKVTPVTQKSKEIWGSHDQIQTLEYLALISPKATPNSAAYFPTLSAPNMGADLKLVKFATQA